MKKFLRNNSRKKPSENFDEDSKAPLSGYARYTSIIYQLVGTIVISFAIGYLLDRIFHLTFPAFKLIFAFGGVILALYIVFKELNKK